MTNSSQLCTQRITSGGVIGRRLPVETGEARRLLLGACLQELQAGSPLLLRSPAYLAFLQPDAPRAGGTPAIDASTADPLHGFGASLRLLTGAIHDSVSHSWSASALTHVAADENDLFHVTKLLEPCMQGVWEVTSDYICCTILIFLPFVVAC